MGRLTPPAARALRADLKEALTEVASGRAGVSSLLHQIERVAKYQTGNHRAALGNPKTQDAMQVLAKNHASYALDNAGLGGVGWDRLYCAVTEARNDIMHTGTEAVLAETRTKALAAAIGGRTQGAPPSHARGLRFRRARTEPECTRVEEVWNACETLGLPLLVTREPGRGEGKEPEIAMHLVGIVTSFDLL